MPARRSARALAPLLVLTVLLAGCWRPDTNEPGCDPTEPNNAQPGHVVELTADTAEVAACMDTEGDTDVFTIRAEEPGFITVLCVGPGTIAIEFGTGSSVCDPSGSGGETPTTAVGDDHEVLVTLSGGPAATPYTLAISFEGEPPPPACDADEPTNDTAPGKVFSVGSTATSEVVDSCQGGPSDTDIYTIDAGTNVGSVSVGCIGFPLDTIVTVTGGTTATAICDIFVPVAVLMPITGGTSTSVRITVTGASFTRVGNLYRLQLGWTPS